MPAFLSVCPDIGHHGNEAPALRPPVLGGMCVRQLEWALGLQEATGRGRKKENMKLMKKNQTAYMVGKLETATSYFWA